MRVHRALALAGVASRRAAEGLVAEGRVSVNGEPATVGQLVGPDDLLEVDGRRVSDPEHLRAYLLHKPAGVVSTAHDPQGRPTVLDDLPADVRVYPVGRLDIDTTGALLVTNDGELAARLMHPSSKAPKTYEALLRGQVSAEAVRRLRRGVELEDGHDGPGAGAGDGPPGGGGHLARDRAHRGAQPPGAPDGRGRRAPRAAPAPLPLRRHRARPAGAGPMAPHLPRRVGPPRRLGGAGALSERVLRAVRGATSVAEDTSEAIRRRTAELLEQVLTRNALVAEDLVSIMFTATGDLAAEFPAVAAREIGLGAVPLICAREIPVVGALEMCIRVMVHCYAPPGRAMSHVYLHEARSLRPDLPHLPQ